MVDPAPRLRFSFLWWLGKTGSRIRMKRLWRKWWRWSGRSGFFANLNAGHGRLGRHNCPIWGGFCSHCCKFRGHDAMAVSGSSHVSRRVMKHCHIHFYEAWRSAFLQKWQGTCFLSLEPRAFYIRRSTFACSFLLHVYWRWCISKRCSRSSAEALGYLMLLSLSSLICLWICHKFVWVALSPVY